MLALYMALIDDEEGKRTFEALYYKYRNRMYHIAYDILRNQQAAEDVTAEAFLIISKNFATVRAMRSEQAEGYIVLVTRHQAIDQFRKRKLENRSVEEMEQDTENTTEPCFLERESGAVAGAVSALPAEYKEVLLLKHYYGFSMQETADILSIPYNTVKTRLKRAKQLFAEELTRMGFHA